MSFSFVDSIVDYEPGVCIRGLKHITEAETYVMPTSTGKQAFMPALIGEALGQLGAWNVMETFDYQYRPVAGIVKSVTLSDNAYVGETLSLETQFDQLSEDSVIYHSQARVGDRLIFTIHQALGPLLPLTEFSDPMVVKAAFKQLCDPAASPIVGAKQFVPDFFDEIVSQTDTRICARKKLLQAAPYLSDHFPRKPVLPLTLLLQGQLSLAEHYLKQRGELATYRPKHIQKVKMIGFVQPGDVILTTMKVDETDAGLRFRYVTTFEAKSDAKSDANLAAKKVCLSQALYER